LSFLYFSLISLQELQGGEREKSMKKKRSQRHNEALIMTVLVLLEDLDEKNPMTSKKITNNDRSMPHETSKEK
jgi:hypothetical protein